MPKINCLDIDPESLGLIEMLNIIDNHYKIKSILRSIKLSATSSDPLANCLAKLRRERYNLRELTLCSETQRDDGSREEISSRLMFNNSHLYRLKNLVLNGSPNG